MGAAPGGWSQVASKYGANVIAIDKVPFDPINTSSSSASKGCGSVECIVGDIFDENTFILANRIINNSKSNRGKGLSSSTSTTAIATALSSSSTSLSSSPRQVALDHGQIVEDFKANVILSDMAPSFSGNNIADKQRMFDLLNESLEITRRVK